MHTITDHIDEIHLTDAELALALGRPEGTKASVVVDDLLALSEGRIQTAIGVTRLGGCHPSV